MPPRLLPGTLALILLLALTGCGSDGDTPQPLDQRGQTAARALALEFQGTDPSDFERDAGICLGKRLVSDLGTEKLVEGGFLKPDLTVNTEKERVASPEAAQGYADAVVACQDVRGEVTSRRAEYPEATDKDIEVYIDCVEAIDDTLLRQAVVASALRKKDKAMTGYAERSRACTTTLGPAKR